jgi:hypothetical protein
MNVYFAGNTGVPSREKMVCRIADRRLFSYYFLALDFYNSVKMFKIAMKKKVHLFLDSGAFSAWTQGVPIDIQEYITFIKENKDILDIYANLDVIGIGGKQPNKLTAQKTLENQKIMEAAGLSPLPCFHFGEPFEFLEYYVANYEYLALGVAGNSGTTLIPWLNECFSKYICDEKGFPKIKVHGFAVTSLKLMLKYPWYSVDSTSWVVTGRMGGIFIPRWADNKWVYDGASWKISVSNQSPNMKQNNQHIETLSPQNRKIIMRYIEEKGYCLGESTFSEVDQSHELLENERWAEKKPANKTQKRKLETIVIPGISNTYQLRDEMNIIYFLDLEKSMPEWPWSFKIQETIQPFF